MLQVKFLYDFNDPADEIQVLTPGKKKIFDLISMLALMPVNIYIPFHQPSFTLIM